MEIIQLNYTDDAGLEELEKSATAIGFFDGLHRGHLKVINKMAKIAVEKKLKKGIMTFDLHPSVVLNPKFQRTTNLTQLEIKLEIFESMDIDYVYIINFSSKLAKHEADDFVQKYIIGSNVSELISGFDYTYGARGRGNTTNLTEYTEFNMTIEFGIFG